MLRVFARHGQEALIPSLAAQTTTTNRNKVKLRGSQKTWSQVAEALPLKGTPLLPSGKGLPSEGRASGCPVGRASFRRKSFRLP